MILTTDPIGDARVAQGASRWQRGDRVHWLDDAGCWRQGEIVHPSRRLKAAITLDMMRREIHYVAKDRLRRIYPRGDE